MPGVEYRVRPGAYAVILARSKRVAVVKHFGLYYLPGGGVEGDETLLECLYREVREETGWSIEAIRELGWADEVISASDRGLYLIKRGLFVEARLAPGSDPDAVGQHHKLWVNLEELRAGAAHESHIWAVETATAVQ